MNTTRFYIHRKGVDIAPSQPELPISIQTYCFTPFNSNMGTEVINDLYILSSDAAKLPSDMISGDRIALTMPESYQNPMTCLIGDNYTVTLNAPDDLLEGGQIKLSTDKISIVDAWPAQAYSFGQITFDKV